MLILVISGAIVVWLARSGHGAHAFAVLVAGIAGCTVVFAVLVANGSLESALRMPRLHSLGLASRDPASDAILFAALAESETSLALAATLHHGGSRDLASRLAAGTIDLTRKVFELEERRDQLRVLHGERSAGAEALCGGAIREIGSAIHALRADLVDAGAAEALSHARVELELIGVDLRRNA